MAMISITFRGEFGTKRYAFDPLKDIELRWRNPLRIQWRMRDMTKPMEHALRLMEENERDLFRTEGASVGSPWQQYTASERRYYLPYKRAVLGAEKPMLRWARGGGEAPAAGERLYPSLIRRPGVQGREWIARAWKDGFEYGTRVPYAANHQYGRGTYKGKYKIQRRVVLKMSDRTMREIVRGMQAHIFEGRFTTPRTRP